MRFKGDGETQLCLDVQVEGEGLMVKPELLVLHRELWDRQQEAIRKASPGALAAEDSAFEAARLSLSQLSAQPEWVQGAQLLPHQLKVALDAQACP